MANENTLFTPANGGLGAVLTCSGTTARVALPEPRDGNAWAINNTGTDNVSLAFGDDDTIEATLAYLSFPPGISYIGIPNAGGSGAPTWMAGITAGETFDVQITAGFVELI